MSDFRILPDLGGTTTYWTNQKPLTADMIYQQIKDAEAKLCTPFAPSKMIYSMHALVDDETRRNFPVSKNRSKRIHKKLVKRFGGEFKKKPAILQLSEGDYKTIVAHPSFRQGLEEKMRSYTDKSILNALYGLPVS